jgi:uncharacterized repeat protein (TIGR01451 family)
VYQGSLYVFVRSGTAWSQQQKLLASDAATGANLGRSVSISGDTILAGAWGDDTMGGNAGAAYVFVRSGTTWTEQQKLLASDGAAVDRFGSYVSLFGDTAVVGAPLANAPAASDAGAAYVFVRSGTFWSEQQKLLASDGVGGDSLGSSVSISADTLIVGAAFDDVPGSIGSVDAGSAYVFVRSGPPWAEQQKLLAADEVSHDRFGWAVSISDDTVVVGAPLDDTTAGGDTGSAYVFVRSGTNWIVQQKLTASDGTTDDLFGRAVAVSGDTAVVGAWADDTSGGQDTGSAYVFVRSGTTWTEQQKLVASDGSVADLFGWSVSISGDTVVVGALGHDTPAGNTGAAYVYVRSASVWTEQQQLQASDAALGDMFGHSVSVSADTVVVGATGADVSGNFDAGAAYVFVRAGTAWSEQQKITASDGASADEFGYSLSVSGDTVVVAAYSDDTAAGTDVGSAYVFVRSGAVWSQQQKLVPSDGSAFEYFGFSVSVFADTVVVGAPFDDPFPDAGAAYVFVRSGTVWTEQQKLLAPDGAANDGFGVSVSMSGDRAVVGAPDDSTPGGVGAGSAHVFGPLEADLGVTKSDGQTAAVPGEPLIYTITVSNAGPSAVAAATVTDMLPAALLGAAWTCSASPGSSCSAGGTGNINDSVNVLAGGTATYVVSGTVDPAATGTLSNTVTVTPPAAVPDPNPANNSATDVDTLTPEADLAITKTDSADPVDPGDPLTYSLSVINDGPSDATGVTVVDSLPAGVTFVSSVPGAPTCSLAGSTLTCDLGALPAGGSSAVTINVTVNAGASGILVNTATVSGSETDPDPGNNSASASTAVGPKDGELTHGTDEVFDLAALPGPVADEDVFRIAQKPYSSYEIVIDATSGDIGAGNGPLLERVDSDGITVLQSSVPIGTGSSRSLRFGNGTASEIEGETIRVRSAGCTTDCGPDDVYRIRAYDTTYSIARFNNTGSQVTVLILQNPTSEPMGGAATFWDASGVRVCGLAFGPSAHGTLVFDTRQCPGVDGIAGSITVVHSLRYGELSGKAVALEPATGFSFDSPLVPRLR